jgi:hypothetical protein
MFTEEKGVYFADFGESAVIANVPATVIFDNAFLASMDVESANPVCLCRDEDVAGVVQGDSVLLRNTNYQVAGIEPDGTGFTMLELRLA